MSAFSRKNLTTDTTSLSRFLCALYFYISIYFARFLTYTLISLLLFPWNLSPVKESSFLEFMYLSPFAHSFYIIPGLLVLGKTSLKTSFLYTLIATIIFISVYFLSAEIGFYTDTIATNETMKALFESSTETNNLWLFNTFGLYRPLLAQRSLLSLSAFLTMLLMHVLFHQKDEAVKNEIQART